MRWMRYELSEANRSQDVRTYQCEFGKLFTWGTAANKQTQIIATNWIAGMGPAPWLLKNVSHTHTTKIQNGMMIGPRTGGCRHQVLLMSSACRRWGLSGRCNCIGTSGCWDGRKFGNVAGLLYYIHTTCPPHCTALLEARQPINEHRRHCQDAYYCRQHRR